MRYLPYEPQQQGLLPDALPEFHLAAKKIFLIALARKARSISVDKRGQVTPSYPYMRFANSGESSSLLDIGSNLINAALDQIKTMNGIFDCRTNTATRVIRSMDRGAKG